MSAPARFRSRGANGGTHGSSGTSGADAVVGRPPGRLPRPKMTREQAIADWRRRLAAGTVAPRDVILALHRLPWAEPAGIAEVLRLVNWPRGGPV